MLILASCTQQEPYILGKPDFYQRVDPNYVSIVEACDIASAHYNAVYGNTRTPKTLSLKGFEIIGNMPTRSADENNTYGFYVLNFQDNEGFAIVSADRRRNDLYAISNEGSIQLSDTLDNPGLNWYLNTYLAGGETPISPGRPNVPDSLSVIGQPQIGVIYEPLLKGFMSQFHQRYPYNKYCFDECGDQAIVGCGPLVIGTIMGFYEWPLSYKEYVFDWVAMRENPEHDGWARLFEIIGRPENTDTYYGENKSQTPLYTISRTFDNLNYSGTQHITFSKKLLMSELHGKNPVIVTGTSPAGGHSWILDGAYVKNKRIITTYPDGYEDISYYYFHCVWGQGGTSNGFYYLDNNHLGGRPDKLDGTHSSPYDFALSTIVYGYSPNK